jgi:hypothetical protein
LAFINNGTHFYQVISNFLLLSYFKLKFSIQIADYFTAIIVLRYLGLISLNLFWENNMKLLILLCLFYSSNIYSNGNFKKIEFSTRNNSITGQKIKKESISLTNLRISGQKQGDVLYFNNGKWDSYPISGLNYLGEWDSETNSPLIYNNGEYEFNSGNHIDAVAGDYFIIGIASTSDPIFNTDWGVGDWIIYNGESWDKISNTGDIKFVFGRNGEVIAKENDYTWEQIDKTASKLEEISDTPDVLTISDDGKVIKWDESQHEWILSEDKTGLAIGNVGSNDIDLDEVTNIDISDSAAIANSKINGLANELNLKLSKTGGTFNGDLNMSQYNLDISGGGTINGVDFDSVFNKYQDTKTKVDLDIPFKEDLFTGQGSVTTFLSGSREWKELNSDLIEEGSNKFFSEDFVINTQLAGYAISTSTNNSDLLLDNSTSIINAFGKVEQRIKVSLDNFVINPSNLSNISLPHFATTGVAEGYLYFDNNTTDWIMKNITGLEYKDTWDASTSAYPSSTDLGMGDYYIVSVNGTTSTDSKDWLNGDWAVYNGTDWLRINNSGTIFGFGSANIRTGNVMPQTNDYTWGMIDKTISSINDLSNVDTSGVQDQQILKWDGTTWLPQDDKTGIEVGTIDSVAIADGTIVDSSIASNANIAQSKIGTLVQDLSNKLSTTGGTLSGDLNLDGTYKIAGVATINGYNISDLAISSQTAEAELLTKEDVFPSGTVLQYLNGNKVFVDLESDKIPELTTSSKLYFADDRVLDTPVGSLYNTGNSDLIVDTDNLIQAIGKLEAQLLNGVIPNGSIGSNIQIDDESITLDKFSDSAISDGHTFMFNGTDWVTSSLTGINYKGQLDPTTAAPGSNSTNGDYYIMTTAGAATWSGAITWKVGDWAIYDEENSEWQQISYAENIVGFKGPGGSIRTGNIMPQQDDYTFDMIDLTGASINLLADVDTTAVQDEYVLKWNGSKWIPGEDLVGFDTISSNNIEDKTIESSHFKADSIYISDFTTLQSTLDLYLPNKANDTTLLQGDLDLGSKNIINSTFQASNNTIDLTVLKNSCSIIDTTIYQSKFDTSTGSIKTFLNGEGNFVSISLDDLTTGQNNLLIDSTDSNDMKQVLNFELSNYIISSSTPLDLQNGDTLLEAFGKIEQGINNVVLGSESSGHEEITSSQALVANDDKKTFIITAGSTDITLPTFTSVTNGYQVTIKRKAAGDVSLKSGDSTKNIDGQNSWILSSNYSTLKVVKGKTQWFIVGRNGSIE